MTIGKARLRLSPLFLAAMIATPVLAADEPCRLVRVAQVDMSIDASGRVNVPMSVGGQTLNMLIDTGGVNSLLTTAAATALSLHPQYIRSDLRIMNFGGYRIDQFVEAHDVLFGGLGAARMTFLVAPPDLHVGADVQGILGPEVLRAYDDDFDFANGKFRLFQRDSCDGSVVYWTSDPSAAIPFEQDEVGHINLDVTLDGKEVRATVDTGAYRTVMDLETAEDLFGFDDHDPALKPLRRTVNGFTYKYPFKSMTFGGEGGVAVSNPDIELMSRDDIRTPRAPHMLLGIGVLRQLHLYISYRRRTMFVTGASAH